MNDHVYLDWAATAPIRYFAKDYYTPGNPNSPHAVGLQANQALNEARQRIMDCLGVKSGKVLFCRCATEAVEWLYNKYKNALNTNLRHYNMGKRFNPLERRFVWCSQYEHDSVQGLTPEYQNDWEQCGLYFHQYVNQITGTVFDIETIGKQAQSMGAFFGSDITATIGHYSLPSNLDAFCDTVWFSGHKFGCEQGIGAIWLSDRLFKHLHGSEDSRNNYGLLHGTPNVSGAIAMSYAMEYAVKWEQQDRATQTLHYYNLFTHLAATLAENRIEFEVVESKDNPKSTCAINAITLYGFNADALVQFLSNRGIYISPGHSACSNNAFDATRILKTFGLTKEEASQTVRISFGPDTTQEDIDAFVNGIVEFKELFV